MVVNLAAQVLPWILVLYIYVPRVLVPTPFALAPMMFFFYLIGLTVQKQPFAGARARHPPRQQHHPTRLLRSPPCVRHERAPTP